ncbi:MAG TPA: mucoidy inhibitor MuiA family protein [Pilimelia sp.]|nr:mucoidy inhibitor MuiA family protein [Pilimelia sp.]
MTTPTELLDAPIAGVTVYLDRARITRRVTVRLPAGDHTLHIGPLPLGLHRDSVRVGGRGPATVLGVDLVTRHHARTPDAAVAELAEQRRALTAALVELADADAVAASRGDFVSQLAQRAGGTYARALAAGETDVSGVTAFADALADQLAAVKARQREVARQQEAVRDRLAALDRQLQRVSKRHEPDRLAAAVALSVVGSAEAGVPVELELSYVVEGAGWKPSYDVRLDHPSDAGPPRLSLAWFGLVMQKTGEDWPECELLLSTARPSGAVTIPELEPWYLDRRRPVALPPAMARSRAIMPQSFAVPASAPAAVAETTEDLLEEALVESTAAVEQGVAAATYRPARPIAVPADGTAHRATVAVFELPVTLDYVTAPVRAPEAHLRATVVNGSGHTLLPGPAAVFHGGDFVGATSLPIWAPGEEVELALGLDDRVRVERKLIRRTATRAALSSTRRRDVEYRTTITNHTPRAARITVLDQLPVSRDDAIVVRETVAEPTPAERTDLGVLTWRFDLEPGQSREVVLGLRVEVARGAELTGWRE